MAGLPTTSTLQLFFAFEPIAFPCSVKMLPFIWSKSALSLISFPFRTIPLGIEPTRRHQSASKTASLILSYVLIELTLEYAESSSSFTNPSSFFIAGGISTRDKSSFSLLAKIPLSHRKGTNE